MNENYQTIHIRFDESICYLRLHRPEDNNTINDIMIEECRHVLDTHGDSIHVLVLEGLPETFCFGADFQAMVAHASAGLTENTPQRHLYDLWLQFATGPYITIAHVRGKTNAGGIGFVAACDIVLADTTAVFSLSELLFGLLPACVLPFLIRRMGFQKAHYMTLTTMPIGVEQAHSWGLVDAYDENSQNLLRKHLLRLRRLSKSGIKRYKHYMHDLNNSLSQVQSRALEANREAFSDSQNIANITRYVETGAFPWEK